MQKRKIYLDNAASTVVPQEVTDVVIQCMKDCWGNPSSPHSEGRNARALLESSRRIVAGLFGVAASSIIFTSGGTEAINASLWGCCKGMGRKIFITSRLEHPAVLRSLETLSKYFHIDILYVHVDRLGHIDMDHLEDLLKQYSHAVVTLMHANNEIGNLLPVKDVSVLCKKYGALFHSDTIQTIGKYHMDLSSGMFDFAVASAHKFHGPKGAGFMYIRDPRHIQSFISGGNQERNLRAGTENTCGIAGLAKALSWLAGSSEETMSHMMALKAYLINALQETFAGVMFNGDAMGRSIYSIVNFSLPLAVDTAILLSRLDMENICVSSGSACSSGSAIGSHVLRAIGADPDRPSLRVSLSRYNTKKDIDELIRALLMLT
jgi:cysteine desulfurase